jgi:hypothetical protein
MDKVFTHGLTVGHTKDHGKIIICMATVTILGAMAESMKENISWIRNTAMVSITGQMVADMKDIGPMENKMVKENIFCQMELLKLGSGKMESVSDGSSKSIQLQVHMKISINDCKYINFSLNR